MSDKSRNPEPFTLSRRDLVRTGVAAAVGLSVGATVSGGAAIPEDTGLKPTPTPPFNPRTHLNMPMRNLGKTGFRVGIFSLGGQATIELPGTEQESLAIINRALDLGVNYIDTAAMYGRQDQWSQKYIGRVMKHRRSEVFLATKTHLRTYDGSMRLLESSLEQLQTDCLDLWQLHNISRTEELDQIFAKDGAIHALTKARDEGMVRFLGIAGHADPHALADGLRRFPFDVILMAVNAADRHHLSFIEHLLPLCLEQELGIVGMKIPSRGRILASWTPPPAEEQPAWARAARPGTLTIAEAFQYAYSLPISTAIVGCDTVAQLEENVRLARDFNPLSPAQMQALEAKTQEIARQALFFRPWETQSA